MIVILDINCKIVWVLNNQSIAKKLYSHINIEIKNNDYNVFEKGLKFL